MPWPDPPSEKDLKYSSRGVVAHGTPSPRVQRLQDLPQVQGIAWLKVMFLGWQEGWVRQECKGPAISSQLGHLGSCPPGVKGSAGSQAPLDVAEAASACTEAQVSLWPQLSPSFPGDILHPKLHISIRLWKTQIVTWIKKKKCHR